MKKILLSFFTVLLSCSAWAYDKYIDGIYYNLNQNKKEATVTYMYLSHPSAYSGDVVIPSTITYSDVAYRVTSIGSEAFSNSSDLTSIEIPNSVINIGTYAFRSCTGLTSIEIPNSVTNIGNEAFTGCTGLTSIEIPNSVTKIGNSAFAGCIGLTSILVSNGNTIYDSRDNCNAIIESATNKLISGCKNTKIPNSVTSVVSAFDGCTSLTSIEIPNSVKSIGGCAFRDCTGLTSIEIPNGVASIGNMAFLGCSNLTSIKIPNSVTSIGNETFRICIGLTSIDIPNSVTSIGGYAFAGCTGLTSIDIPNSVLIINSNVFSGCSNLTSINIPYNVIEIGNSAFSDCTGLTSMEIPNSVTIIRTKAFQNCTGMASVEIPNSVKAIDTSAFDGCTNLKCVNITDISSWFDINFSNREANPLFHAHHLYMNDIEVKDLVIPNNVTTIKNNVFSGCTGLTSIDIPNSVTSIGWSAFYGCTALTSITCEATTPPTCGNYTFGNVDKSTCTLYVPEGSVEDYKIADQWKDFYNIVGYATGIDDVKNTEVEGSISYFDFGGQEIPIPQKGLNIIKKANGQTIKVFVR